MKSDDTQSSASSKYIGKAALLSLLIFGALLRVWSFPAATEVRDWDELGYTCNGLMAWEGVSPGWVSTPAGPQTWVGYLYAAGRSGWEFVTNKDRANLPRVLKPYLALDQALFKSYEDLNGLRRCLLWISMLLSLAGIYGGFRLGAKYGGFAGGLLIGGVVTVLPLYIDLCGIAKSASDAWMYALLAISCAATLSDSRRYWLPGVFLGLAIASRVDMLIAVPLVFWAVWENTETGLPWKVFFATFGSTFAATLMAAPFAVEGFVGLVRTILSARVLGYWPVPNPRMTSLIDLVWHQGLGPMLLVMVIGIFLFPTGTKLKRVALTIFAGLMLATMFDGKHMVMRYHGGPILALLTCAAIAAGALFQKLPMKLALALAILLLALPAVQAVRMTMVMKALYTPENSTEWIDEHVPPGTPVYVHPAFISHAVLPTPAAGTAIWDLVSENHAWQTRMAEGFDRFSLPKEYLPRALSEDNLDEDRGLARRWFILGGGHSTRPRFDVRMIALSATFGLQRSNVGAEFQKDGGVVIWRTASSGLPPGLGEPYKAWTNNNGDGTLLFISPDVQAKLKK